MESKRKPTGGVEVDEGMYMRKLSARERNMLKRKAKREQKSVSNQQGFLKSSNSLNSGGSSNGSKRGDEIGIKEEEEDELVDITEQPGQEGKIVVEAKQKKRQAFVVEGVKEGEWAFKTFIEQLSVDLFEPRWEICGFCVGSGGSTGARNVWTGVRCDFTVFGQQENGGVASRAVEADGSRS
ncbi:putative helicase mot1 [Zancudomyces culisetae]|uniref:Putative helicase mot1 n=1 Tax=Zancudomyces culisetae TaxID=1213189 RepID=A0A1R1PK04_ZANCU|nr:putative helicase mot1 [Zancudomyces culisetae]|eukprot:OMH81253.1 putative helicase mot1 [Zancudomyces culisetae]